MHFKLDENVPVQLEAFIKTAGHSASTVFSEKISGIKDAGLLELCKEKNYAVVTIDSDFATAYKFRNGIIVLRTESQGAKSAVRAFENLVKSFDLRQVANKIIIVEDRHIRVRDLGESLEK